MFLFLGTIANDGFSMVLGQPTIGNDGFSMVGHHWSNDEMVTCHCRSLSETVPKKCFKYVITWSLITVDQRIFLDIEPNHENTWLRNHKKIHLTSLWCFSRPKTKSIWLNYLSLGEAWTMNWIKHIFIFSNLRSPALSLSNFHIPFMTNIPMIDHAEWIQIYEQAQFPRGKYPFAEEFRAPRSPGWCKNWTEPIVV